MTTDTEALRRAFEASSLDGGLTPGDLEWNGRFYIVPFTQDEWLTFQAGHAAAVGKIGQKNPHHPEKKAA